MTETDIDVFKLAFLGGCLGGVASYAVFIVLAGIVAAWFTRRTRKEDEEDWTADALERWTADLNLIEYARQRYGNGGEKEQTP